MVTDILMEAASDSIGALNTFITNNSEAAEDELLQLDPLIKTSQWNALRKDPIVRAGCWSSCRGKALVDESASWSEQPLILYFLPLISVQATGNPPLFEETNWNGEKST